MRAVCVIGLGLIGGSILRAATAAGRQAWGATASAADEAAAAADGYAVEDVAAALRRAAAEDALVVLAVPLPSVVSVLRTVAEHAPRARLTDAVSVKQPVIDAVSHHAPFARYVGGHPMAGAAASGWAAGSSTLFHGAAWVVSAVDGTDIEVWSDVARLALDAGAHVVATDPAEHDAAVARISHLPHVLAAVLAAVGADAGPLPLALAAGSFGDGTRVAGSNPELVRAMCEGNGAALLPVLDDALGRLGAARGALASTGSLAATLREGHRGRRQLDGARAAEVRELRLDLTAPDAMAALRRTGTVGGRIVAIDTSTLTAEIPTCDHFRSP